MCDGLVLFFFQAEGGIRYLTVTGVQTCALPISVRSMGPASPANGQDHADLRWTSRADRPHGPESPQLSIRALGWCVPRLRSEERRGGKEWRSRWVPEH